VDSRRRPKQSDGDNRKVIGWAVTHCPIAGKKFGGHRSQIDGYPSDWPGGGTPPFSIFCSARLRQTARYVCWSPILDVTGDNVGVILSTPTTLFPRGGIQPARQNARQTQYETRRATRGGRLKLGGHVLVHT
jgi:hypothetical protein